MTKGPAVLWKGLFPNANLKIWVTPSVAVCSQLWCMLLLLEERTGQSYPVTQVLGAAAGSPCLLIPSNYSHDRS